MHCMHATHPCTTLGGSHRGHEVDCDVVRCCAAHTHTRMSLNPTDIVDLTEPHDDEFDDAQLVLDREEGRWWKQGDAPEAEPPAEPAVFNNAMHAAYGDHPDNAYGGLNYHPDEDAAPAPSSSDEGDYRLGGPKFEDPAAFTAMRDQRVCKRRRRPVAVVRSLVADRQHTVDPLNLATFLRFDSAMFEHWCQFIGIMEAWTMWKDGIEPPSMQQLLNCIELHHPIGQNGSTRQIDTASLHNLTQYVFSHQVKRRLYDCLVMVKLGVDPWSLRLKCPCVYLMLGTHSNYTGDRMFQAGDPLVLRGTRVSKHVEGPWVEAAVRVGDDLLYCKTMQMLCVQQNQERLQQLLPFCVLENLPLNVIKDPKLGVDWHTKVVACEGSYIITENGLRLFNPKQTNLNNRTLQERLERTVTMGQQAEYKGGACSLQIGCVAFWYWPDRGGWFSFTVQNITETYVYECLEPNGTVIDARFILGQLMAYPWRADGGVPVPWAKDPPVHTGVWNSAGDAGLCAQGWGLDQPIRVEPPPNHQQPVSTWQQHGARQKPVHVGDWVLCKDADWRFDWMVHIAVVVGFGDDGEIHMRVPVQPVDELTLLGTRSEQKCVDKLVEEGCWRDVQVTPLEFAAAHEVIGGTHEAWDGFFHQRLGALQTWNELLGAKMQMLQIECSIKITSLRDKESWKFRVPSWMQEVAMATSEAALYALLRELVVAVKQSFGSTAAWACVDNAIKVGDATSSVLEHFQSQPKCLYKDWQSIQPPMVPNESLLLGNYHAAMQYSDAFPVKVHYTSTCPPMQPWPSILRRAPGSGKYVFIDIGAGLASVMQAGRRVKEMLAILENDNRDFVYYIYEVDEDALAVLKKWYHREIQEGRLVLCGNMHWFRSSHVASEVPTSIWMSIMCKWICAPGSRRDVGDIVSAVELLALPEGWHQARGFTRSRAMGLSAESESTFKQCQSCLRVINWALRTNPDVMLNFEETASMGPIVEMGLFRLFDGAARFHNTLNEAKFAGGQRVRLRWGNHFVPAPITFGGPRSLWQTYLGNPETGAMVAPACKAHCVTQVSQSSHFETDTLPLTGEAGVANTLEGEFHKRSSMYNVVRCPREMLVKSMPRVCVEGMQGFFAGVTDGVSEDASKRLLAQVFAHHSVSWLWRSQVTSLQDIEEYMVSHYQDCIKSVVRCWMVDMK